MPETSRFTPSPAVAIAAAMVPLLAFGACSERQTPSPATSPPPVGAPSNEAVPAQVPAPTAPAAQPTYTLILTWMNADQPPQTTQTVFHDLASCTQARDAAIAEGRRLALEAMATQPPAPDKASASSRRYIGTALLPTDAAPAVPASSPASAPKVAAICAAA